MQSYWDPYHFLVQFKFKCTLSIDCIAVEAELMAHAAGVVVQIEPSTAPVVTHNELSHLQTFQELVADICKKQQQSMS